MSLITMVCLVAIYYIFDELEAEPLQTVTFLKTLLGVQPSAKSCLFFASEPFISYA